MARPGDPLRVFADTYGVVEARHVRACDSGKPPQAERTGGPWRRLYAGWLELAVRFGEVQTLIVVTLIYALVMGPVALVMRAARQDPLRKRGLWAPGSEWGEADTTSAPDVERARRLF